MTVMASRPTATSISTETALTSSRFQLLFLVIPVATAAIVILCSMHPPIGGAWRPESLPGSIPPMAQWTTLHGWFPRRTLVAIPATASRAITPFLSSMPPAPNPARVGLGAGGIDDKNGGIALEAVRSEEHTSELQPRVDLVCRLLLE